MGGAGTTKDRAHQEKKAGSRSIFHEDPKARSITTLHLALKYLLTTIQLIKFNSSNNIPILCREMSKRDPHYDEDQGPVNPFETMLRYNDSRAATCVCVCEFDYYLQGGNYF